MGLTSRKFDGYVKISPNTIRNRSFVTDEVATRYANNAIALARMVRRNYGMGTGYYPDRDEPTDLTYVVKRNRSATIIAPTPIDGMVSGATPIRCWVYLSHDDTDSGITLNCSVGKYTGSAVLPDAAGFQWVVLQLEQDLIQNPNNSTKGSLSLSLCAFEDSYAGTDNVTVRSIGIHEIGDDNVPDWIDTSGASNVLLNTDYPLSSAARRILASQMATIYGARVPRANIYNKCLLSGYNATDITDSYGADHDRLGRWIVRKAKGITSFEVMYHLHHWEAGTPTIRFTLGAPFSLAYNTQTAGFHVGELIVGQTSGAYARILSDDDAGLTGTLAVGYINGTFTVGETIIDQSGGSATAGAVGGFVDIDAFESTTDGTSYFGTDTITDLIDAFAEYEVRMDAKNSAANHNTVNSHVVFICEKNTVDDDVVLPNSFHFEQDDDGLSKDWTRIAKTLRHIWKEGTQIVLDDHRRRSESFYVGGPSGSLRFLEDSRTWGSSRYFVGGILWPSRYPKNVILEVWFKRSADPYWIDITTTDTFVKEDKLTGATSGATAYIFEDGFQDEDKLGIGHIVGSFINGETIDSAIGYSLTLDGMPYRTKSDIEISAWTSHFDLDAGDPDYVTLNTATINHDERDGELRYLFKLPIVDWHRNNLALNDHWPYVWALHAISTYRQDHLVLSRWRAYEEPVGSGDWITSEEDAL